MSQSFSARSRGRVMRRARNLDQSRHDVPTTRRICGLAAATILAILGIGAVAKGLEGHATVRDALALEHIVGQPYMTPGAIAGKAKAAGLQGVALPTCSVAGEAVDDGASARCFAQYMRVDALMATGGKTYAQMPRFATDDGKGTNIEAAATKGPDGRAVNNPARNVWVTETALSTALNTSFMAEQISLFGIAVGAAFLLVSVTFAVVALGGLRLPTAAFALAHRRQARPRRPQTAA